MHEVGLMQEALRIALTNAERSGATRIHALTMRIGPLAGVEMEALGLAFQVVTSDTPAGGAALRFEEAPVTCWCIECECLFQPGTSVFRCPHCHRLSDDVRQGREFDLVAVEVS
jgi:hydrogenase nickel incorporation protein HypA/HybF